MDGGVNTEIGEVETSGDLGVCTERQRSVVRNPGDKEEDLVVRGRRSGSREDRHTDQSPIGRGGGSMSIPVDKLRAY